MAEIDKRKAEVTINGHPVPERVWIDFRDKPANRYWRVYTAPNAFANAGYVRVEQLTGLREALQEIVDQDTLCNCEHDTEWCCVRVGEYCAFCIAATALTQRAAGGES